MFHVIGDSNTAVFTGTNQIQPKWPSENGKVNNLDKIKFIKTYRINAGTAYNSKYKAIPMINNIIKNNIIKNNDTIIFCFGEVDCRAHLIKQFKIQNKKVGEIIYDCVNRLLETIMYFKNKGFNVVAYGPVASFKDENSNKIPVNRWYGNEKLRNKVTDYFNCVYKILCKKNNIPFFTIFYNLIQKDLKSKDEYHLDDFMHYSNKVIPFILEEMLSIKLINFEQKYQGLNDII